METVSIVLAGLTAIVLFLFGLEGFSKEIEKISGDRFRKSLSKATTLPIVGVAIGALVTAVIQSSSATSVITISLVNAGVLSFKNSVGIIFGANVGTTVTAQLIAFKLTKFAPVLILLGFLLSMFKSRYSIFSKTIFYFGFVFFSLNLISSSLSPLQNNEALVELLIQPQHPFYGILVGCLFTALIQSSSVTTGLAIIFTQQGLLGLENAVPLIMGANIGTTATALLSMVKMDIAAKKTALSHFLFNVGGVVIFIPALLVYGYRLGDINAEPAIALASIHLVFNLATSLIFLLFIKPFSRFVDKFLGEGKMDFERIELPVFKEDSVFRTEKYMLENSSSRMFGFVQENYNAVTLSLETNYRAISETATKRIEYTSFLKKEYIAYLAKIATTVDGNKESKELIRLISRFDYIFKIQDTIEDLFEAKQVIAEHYIELHSDILVLLRDLATSTMAFFEVIHRSFEDEDVDIKEASKDMQRHLNLGHRQLLAVLADPTRRDAGALTSLVTYSQALKDKLVMLSKVKRLEKIESQLVEGDDSENDNATMEKGASGEEAS